MSVINPANNTVIATITVGSGPAGVAVNPTGTDVFVTNLDGNTVSVINPATNSVVANLTVGAGPFGAAVSPTTGDVFVTETSSNVSVIS
ncbi:MAG: YncE family protein [Mycobacterium sp.]